MDLAAIYSLLSRHRPGDAKEARDLQQMRALCETSTGLVSRQEFSPGHFTASAFAIDRERGRMLLILHKKLGRWLQPGGHLEPHDPSPLAAARRELQEETGLTRVEAWPSDEALFDVDIHSIPAHRNEPAHLHLDLRFLFHVHPDDTARATPEVHDFSWFSFEDARKAGDASVGRAVDKWLRLASR